MKYSDKNSYSVHIVLYSDQMNSFVPLLIAACGRGMKKAPESPAPFSCPIGKSRSDLFRSSGCGRSGGSIRDAEFFLHCGGDVGEGSLVEIGERTRRSVEYCQIAACGSHFVDRVLGLLDNRGQQLVLTLLEVLLGCLLELVAALNQGVEIVLLELAYRFRKGVEILLELLQFGCIRRSWTPDCPEDPWHKPPCWSASPSFRASPR